LDKINKKDSLHLTIGFEKGVPVSLNDKELRIEILQVLNKTVGSYGFGQGYYTEIV